MDRISIKERARENFTAQYWPVVGINVLAVVILAGLGALSYIPILGLVAAFGLTPIITVGILWFSLKIYRGEEATVETLFEPFQNFGHVLGGYWYMVLFIFLWSLLLFIPGIIKAIAYQMAPYILMDQPDIPATEALEKSMDMTDGHKWEIFVFDLSFLGWFLLAALTLDIVGFLYVFP